MRVRTVVRSFRPYLFLPFLILNSQFSIAQESADTTSSPDSILSPWNSGGSFAVNFNQVALSNWSGGGENTITIGGLVSLGSDYDQGNRHWANDLELGYGITKIGDLGFRKSNDKITLVSKFDYNATERFLYSALLDFRTQFNDGFDYNVLDSLGEPQKVSEFLAPGYLNVGLGLTWKPAEYFELLLAPLSNRLIIVIDDELSAAGAFGVDPGENLQSELGATSRLKFDKELMENVRFNSMLNLFAPYEDITSIVVGWENLLGLRVNDFITTSISLDVRYEEAIDITRDDGTVGPATQVKEALTVGVGYSFR